MTVSGYKRMFKCDAARIARFPGKLFLILGWNRNTRDDPGQWQRLEDGEYVPYDFDYLKERVVASGGTEAALLKSAKEYKRLEGMSMEQYLTEECRKLRRKRCQATRAK